jgi:hypothetical protein
VVEQRKAKRFEIKLPLRLVRNGARPVIGTGETKNMSSSGVLFATNAKIEVGEPLEYVITLMPTDESPASVDLHCLGKVTRFDAVTGHVQNGGGQFEVAATLERYEFVRNASN